MIELGFRPHALHNLPAGKTTLLNALAGQLPMNASLTLSGSISVNGISREGSHHRQGYVQQEDIFFSQLTVKCALMLSAVPPPQSSYALISLWVFTEVTARVLVGN